MVEADADVMLIDEVLAVGDAAFGQKCLNVFRQRRQAGRTIVLVTHDMATVQSFCDRALLIHDSELRYIGDPDETALRYYRLNFGADGAGTATAAGVVPEVNVRIQDTWLEDAAGERVPNIEQHQPFRFNCLIEARRELRNPVFGFHFMGSDGARIFGFNKTLQLPDGATDVLRSGQRVLISGEVENRLLPGSYHVNCWISRNRAAGDLALHPLRLLEFTVYGTEPGPGSVALRDDVRAEILTEEDDQ
jgi:hypothetical protein